MTTAAHHYIAKGTSQIGRTYYVGRRDTGKFYLTNSAEKAHRFQSMLAAERAGSLLSWTTKDYFGGKRVNFNAYYA